MKKVTAFVGSGHKRLTHNAVRQFLDDLQSFGDVETELVTLSDYRIGTCRGCRLCFEKGRGELPHEGRPGRAHREDHGVRRGRFRLSELLVPGFRHAEGLPRQARLCLSIARASSGRPSRASSPRDSSAARRSSSTWISPPIAWASTPSRATASRPWTRRRPKKRKRGTEALAVQSRRFHETNDQDALPVAVAPEALGLSDGLARTSGSSSPRPTATIDITRTKAGSNRTTSIPCA